MKFCSNCFRSIVRGTVSLLFIGSVGIVVSVSRRAELEKIQMNVQGGERKEQEISKHAAEARKHLSKVQRLARLAHVRAERARKYVQKQQELEHKREKRHQKRIEQELKKRSRERREAQARFQRKKQAHRRAIERHIAQVRASLAHAAVHTEQIQHHAATMHFSLVTPVHKLTRAIANATLSAQAAGMHKQQPQEKKLKLAQVQQKVPVVPQSFETVQKHMADVQGHAQQAIAQTRELQARVKNIVQLHEGEAALRTTVEKARGITDVRLDSVPLAVGGERVSRRSAKKRLPGEPTTMSVGEGGLGKGVVICTKEMSSDVCINRLGNFFKQGWNLWRYEGETLDGFLRKLMTICRVYLVGMTDEELKNTAFYASKDTLIKAYQDLTELDIVTFYSQKDGDYLKQWINTGIEDVDYGPLRQDILKWGQEALPRYQDVVTKYDEWYKGAYNEDLTIDNVQQILSSEGISLEGLIKDNPFASEISTRVAQDLTRYFIKNKLPIERKIKDFFTENDVTNYFSKEFTTNPLSKDPGQWYDEAVTKALKLPADGPIKGFPDEMLPQFFKGKTGQGFLQKISCNWCRLSDDFYDKVKALFNGYQGFSGSVDSVLDSRLKNLSVLSKSEQNALVQAIMKKSVQPLTRFCFDSTEEGTRALYVDALKSGQSLHANSIFEQANFNGYTDDEVSNYVTSIDKDMNSAITELGDIFDVDNVNLFTLLANNPMSEKTALELVDTLTKFAFRVDDAVRIIGKHSLSFLENTETETEILQGIANRSLEDLAKVYSWYDTQKSTEGFIKWGYQKGLDNFLGIDSDELTFMMEKAQISQRLDQITDWQQVKYVAEGNFKELGISVDDALAFRFADRTKDSIPTGQEVKEELEELGYAEGELPTYSRYVNYLRTKGLISQDLTAEQKAAIDGYLKRCKGPVGSCAFAVDKDLPDVVQGKALKYSVDGSYSNESEWMKNFAKVKIGKSKGNFTTEDIVQSAQDAGFSDSAISRNWIEEQANTARNFKNLNSILKEESAQGKRLGGLIQQYAEEYPQFKQVEDLLDTRSYKTLGGEGISINNWEISAELREAIASKASEIQSGFLKRELFYGEEEEFFAAGLLDLLFA